MIREKWKTGWPKDHAQQEIERDVEFSMGLMVLAVGHLLLRGARKSFECRSPSFSILGDFSREMSGASASA